MEKARTWADMSTAERDEHMRAYWARPEAERVVASHCGTRYAGDGHEEHNAQVDAFRTGVLRILREGRAYSIWCASNVLARDQGLTPKIRCNARDCAHCK